MGSSASAVVKTHHLQTCTDLTENLLFGFRNARQNEFGELRVGNNRHNSVLEELHSASHTVGSWTSQTER